MKIFFTAGLLLFAIPVFSQHEFKGRVISENGPLSGAYILWKKQKLQFVTDSSGLFLVKNVSAGLQEFSISHVGYHNKEIRLGFPLASDSIVVVKMDLEEEHEEEEEIVIAATRTSRTIANTPTRTEVISGEELDEKANMKPGDIRMLLSESTGIQTQQTSATSYNSSIRIQGLDGRYTQILRDGYPLYGGFAGGLSLMQIVPLDLKQVEVIKGSSSTLYGGGAIAGLVNLVSKTPGPERNLQFLVNGTSAGGMDVSSFFSQRFNSIGASLFMSWNSSAPYDPAGIGLTAIPKFKRYTVNPRLFFYGNKLSADVGLNYITEVRTGGSIDYIKNDEEGFFEKNNTSRTSLQAGFNYRLNEKSNISFKNSYSRFARRILIAGYEFNGLQQSGFSELAYYIKGSRMDWVAGLNFLTDDFAEDKPAVNPRDYHYATIGMFLQNTWTPDEKFALETGLRGDYVDEYGFELLPKISAMWRPTDKITVRAGGGLGYKTPTVFNEESERIQLQNVLPINPSITRNERSIGTNVDINYRSRMGEVGVSINQLFFYTRLNRPLVLTTTGSSDFEFLNLPGHIDTRGFETNLKFTYRDFKLFVGYTFADVKTHVGDEKYWLPLTARHRLNNVLMYEVEEKWKVGLEAYYTSRQRLNDAALGKSYWVMGFMVEKIWEHLAIYINFENFTDSRQTKFDTIFTGTVQNPVFRDIYAPVDGFVVNGGIKIRL